MGWLKKDPSAETSQAQPKPANSLPHLSKYPVGSVHLVQPEAKFVLIRSSSRLFEVSPDADLLTYDEGGRPTGKLKLSPERKSGFLAADIVEGSPKTGDRVLWFGHQGGHQDDGDFPRDPGAPLEFLE